MDCFEFLEIWWSVLVGRIRGKLRVRLAWPIGSWVIRPTDWAGWLGFVSVVPAKRGVYGTLSKGALLAFAGHCIPVSRLCQGCAATKWSACMASGMSFCSLGHKKSHMSSHVVTSRRLQETGSSARRLSQGQARGKGQEEGSIRMAFPLFGRSGGLSAMLKGSRNVSDSVHLRLA